MGNEQDAEDMVQEAYLKLWQKRHSLTEVLNTEAFCVTLIKNICYDSLRSRHPNTDDSMPGEIHLTDDTKLEEKIEKQDEVNIVQGLINRLPEPQKTILQMKDIDDFTIEEIEQTTGLTTVNIRVILSRSRKR